MAIVHIWMEFQDSNDLPINRIFRAEGTKAKVLNKVKTFMILEIPYEESKKAEFLEEHLELGDPMNPCPCCRIRLTVPVDDGWKIATIYWDESKIEPL